MPDKSQEKSIVQKFDISEAHKLIAYWAAHGKDYKEIARELGYAESTIKSTLNRKEIKFFIAKVKHDLYGRDAALHIKECAAKGVKIAETIMEDKKVKPHVRLIAAHDFMDRAYGKPGIEDGLVEGTVRKILQALQKPVDSMTQETKNDIEDAQYSDITPETTKVEEAPKEVDKVDDWIGKNIK